MPAKLSPKERLKLVQRALGGENIAALCLEAGISRTLLYRWIKRFKEGEKRGKLSSILRPKQKEGNGNGQVSEDKVKLILDRVVANPEWSVDKIVANLPKDEQGKPMVGHHGVQNVLKRLDLNTIEKRQNFQKQAPELSTTGYKPVKSEDLALPHKEIRPQDRLTMIERVKAGEPVSRVCELYGVSRTILYRWLKRYEEAPEGKKLEALWDKKPKVEKYFNQAPEEYEQAVLMAVRQYPELSTHKLVGVLPQVGGRPVLGNHGVQNVLRRYNLSTYEQRFAYARAYRKPTFVAPFLGVFQTVLSFVSSLTPQLRGFVVKGSFALVLGLFIGVILYGAVSLAGTLAGAPTLAFSIGIIFALLAFSFGMFFFLYSLKYYFVIAIVLSFSRHAPKEGKESEQEERGANRSFWASLFGVSNSGQGNEGNHINGNVYKEYQGGGGLQPDLSNVVLTKKPFVSIHLAIYNEKKVVERLLTAATSMDYENYEVVVVDDSTDETVELVKKWENHPRVKIIHRESREGFKGGALRRALAASSPKTEFVLVFDADFIPYPDTIVQFLKYFQNLTGGLGKEDLKNTKIAAIQGYQWHVLNKSENWITRGVRSEYAGSYVIERSGAEIYQGLKQIAGSVYMIRKDALESIGWGTSITEDFELTLKLYEQGYKVAYTPYIQAPAEAVSTIRRLIRQRMRWAEGHSHNIKKMFFRLLRSPKLTLPEKLEFLYISPYYLQATLFILGSFSWFLAEVVFRVRLPFWTELWGWSLVLTNMFALPLMNMVGLFLEESEEKDYLGLFSFIALSYIVAPFQGYAALKGFLEKEEGPWFRTPKTGKITDIFTPGRFYRFIFGVFGQPAFVPQQDRGFGPLRSEASEAKPAFASATNLYLNLATANNRFDQFAMPKVKRLPWMAKITLSLLLAFTTTLLYVSQSVQVVYATQMAGPMKLALGPANAVGESWPTQANFLQNTTTMASSGQNLFIFHNTCCNPGSANYYWYTNLLPVGGGSFIIPSGQYNLNIARTLNLPNNNKINFGIQLVLNNSDASGQNVILDNTTHFINNSSGTMQGNLVVVNTMYALRIGSIGSNITYSTPSQRFGVRIYVISGTHTTRSNITLIINNASLPAVLAIPSNIEVPEIPNVVIFIFFMAIMPAVPGLMSGRFRKEGRNIFEEFSLAWQDFIKKLLGQGEEALDKLPV